MMRNRLGYEICTNGSSIVRREASTSILDIKLGNWFLRKDIERSRTFILSEVYHSGTREIRSAFQSMENDIGRTFPTPEAPIMTSFTLMAYGQGPASLRQLEPFHWQKYLQKISINLE